MLAVVGQCVCHTLSKTVQVGFHVMLAGHAVAADVVQQVLVFSCQLLRAGLVYVCT